MIPPRAPRHALLAAAACALALAAPGCGHAPAAPPRGGLLTVARRDTFATFDPAFAWTPDQAPYLDLVYEGLVAFDDSGRVRPAGADRWTVSADRRRVRFHLRDGARYADGRPVRARDFAHGIARLFRPGALRSPGAAQFACLVNALVQGTHKAPPLGVDAPDDSTLVLRLAWPDPWLLAKLAQPRYAIPVPESLDALPGAGYGRPPATTGPYRFARAGAETLLFVRNPHYAAGADSGGADTIRVLGNRQARMALLGMESGRVDALAPPPLEYVARLARSPNVSVEHAFTDPPLTWYLALNAELFPLARRDARRAVAWGVNRERMVEQLGPWFAPERRFAPPRPGDGPAPAATAPGYDPAQASVALADAEAMSGIRVPITVPRATPLAAALDALAPGLARANIQVDANPVPGADWERAALARRGAQAIVLPFRAPCDDPFEALAALLVNRGLRAGWAGNVAWYHPDAGLDSLLLAGLASADPAARAALRGQVETLLASDLPLLPLARVEDCAAIRRPWGNARFVRGIGLRLRSLRRQAPPPAGAGSDTSP